MNNLPKSWGVYFEKQPGPKNPVILYLNSLKKLSFDLVGHNQNVYYGIDLSGNIDIKSSKTSFETILTEYEFLKMVSLFSTVEPIIYNVIESVDCEVISLRSSTDESKIIDLFKSLINEDSDSITDEQINLCVENKVYYGVSNYKVYLLNSKITQK